MVEISVVQLGLIMGLLYVLWFASHLRHRIIIPEYLRRRSLNPVYMRFGRRWRAPSWLEPNAR